MRRALKQLLPLLLIAPPIGCKSQLLVQVDQYQGELILSQEARKARIQALSAAIPLDLQHKFFDLYSLLQEGGENDPDVAEKRRVAVRSMVAIARFFVWIDEQGSSPRATVIYDITQILKQITISEPLKGGQAFRVAPDQWDPISLELRDWSSVAAEEMYSQLEPLAAPTPSPQHVEAAEFAIGLAERLHVLARSLELEDAQLRNWFEIRTDLRMVDASEPPIDWLEREFAERGYDRQISVEDWYAEFEDRRSKIRAAILGSEQEFRSKYISIPKRPTELQDYAADYYDTLYSLWSIAQDNYPRISGLANFAIKEVATAAVDNTHECNVGECDHPECIRRRQWLSILRAQEKVTKAIEGSIGDLVGTKDEPKKKLAKTKSEGPPEVPGPSPVIRYLDTVQAALGRLREMENPYVNVQPTSAYLALEEIHKAIAGQGRPGYDLGIQWKLVTTVDVEAYANANYVVMRDHLGNWQVKAASNDPTELINAAYGGTLATLNVLSQSGSGSQFLKNQIKDLYAKEAAGKVHPLAMDHLVKVLKAEHDENAQVKKAAIDELDKTIVEHPAKIEELAEAIQGMPTTTAEEQEAKKAKEEEKAALEKELEEARGKKKKALEEKLAIHRELVEDLVNIQRALVSPPLPEPDDEEEGE